MSTQPQRTCPNCGNELSGAMEFCPVCMLRRGLGGDGQSGESAFEESAEPTVEQASQQFEYYELVKGEDGKALELGRGAMGVTYKAFDVDLRCPVALKVISERYLGDESARLRFLREARAAARLRHSNIASVLHLGRTGSSYFYAMEFVEGETLESLIKRSGRLEVKLALEISTQVAAGLGAVHKQKLVHRDIKPSNIMVNPEEGSTVTVKIIDLGLAKPAPDAPAETAISTPEAFAGTPEFASPEQFAGVVVDIRSDLYSLGVVLWEMVTGHAVFRGSPAEVMYQHQHAPLPLEKLEHVPQPVLVLIEVLLEKDPGRRFQNPADLLNALPKVTEAVKTRHTITHQSLREIAAQRPGASGKAIQLLTNMRDVIAARGVRLVLWPALVLVSIGLSIWLLQSQRHSSEQLLALQQKFEKLEEGVNSFALVQNKVRQEQPGQKPEEIEERTYEELGKKLGIDAATLKAQLPRFAEELKKAPNATAYERANAAYVAKDYNEAERLALAAADEAQRASPPKNGDAIKALELAAWAAEQRIEYADALNRLREAEPLTDRARDPVEWARVQFAIAWVLDDQGQYRDAERILREVLSERERSLGPAHRDTLATRYRLGIELEEQRKSAEAEMEFRALIKLEAEVLGPEHPETLATRNNLANALVDQGKYAEAETEERAVIKLREKVLGPEHPDTLKTRNNLGILFEQQGKYAEAETEDRAVIKLREKMLGPEHPLTLGTRNNLGLVLDEEGKYWEAETEDRAVIKLEEKVLGPDHPDTLNTRNNLVFTLDDEGKTSEAETEARAVIKLREKVLGPEHPETLNTRDNLAEVLDHEGKYAEAEMEDRAVIKLREKVLGAEHPDTLRSRNALAEVLIHQGKYAEAEAEDRMVIKLREKVLGPEHPDTLNTRDNLAEALADQDKNAEAETEYSAVLKLEEKALGPEHPQTLRTCFRLAGCLRSEGRTEEASTFAQRAADGARKVLGPDHPDTKKYEQLRQELVVKAG